MKTDEEVKKIKSSANKLKSKGFGAFEVSKNLQTKYNEKFFCVDKSIFMDDTKKVRFIKEIR